MTKAKEQLEKASKIIEEKNIDGFLNLITDKNGLVDGLDLNTLYTLLEKYRAEYKKEVEKTEKKINKADKEVKLNYEELIKITTELKEDIDKINNLKLGYELRKHPVYDHQTVNEIKKIIQEYGLIEFLEDNVSKIHLGDNKNIYRKLLMGFNVMRGKGSYLSETIAESGTGKSLEDEIAFLLMIPKEYIFKKNLMTFASFTRYSNITEYYFDRLIVYFGDFGSKKSFKKIEDIFDVFKVLISEKEYSRDLSDKADNGNYENVTLNLKVNSIGGVYSSILNSFTNNDKQLESRTIKSTPAEVKEDELLRFIGYLNYEYSPQSLAKDKAGKELIKFQEYLKYLVNSDIVIVNPYIDLFMEYSQESEVSIRELKQQLELFDGYCLLTNYDCKMINGHYVASQKQVKDYFNKIALENALIPYESNFLKMIMAKGKKYELTLLDDEKEDYLNKYFNHAMEDLQEQKNLYDMDYYTFDDLEPKQEQFAIKKLMQLYRVDKNNPDQEKVFFTITDINRVYRKHKDYKNIEDLTTLLYKLNKNGYLGKLDYKFQNKNIYYLTVKCENIINTVEFTEKDIISSNKYLSDVGIVK